jgi:DNA repair protein RadA/Sms
MPKTAAPRLKTQYVCTNCGAVQLRWAGKCPECGEWNTLVEEVVEERLSGSHANVRTYNPTPQKLSEIQLSEIERLQLPIGEFSRVLGGGIVPGSLVLIGGEPGVGKCVTGDTRVLNPETGDLVPIARLFAQQQRPANVLAIQTSTLQLTKRAITVALEQGVASVVEVTTRLGRRVRCTPSHPVLTPTGWRAVGELRRGSRIATPRSLPHFGSERLTDAEVKLIAYLLSDGCAQSAISVTNALPEVESDLQAIAGEFAMTLRVYSKKNNRARQYRFVTAATDRMKARREFAAILRQAREDSGWSWAEWSRQAAVPYGALNNWRQARAVPNKADLARLAAIAGASLSPMAEQLRNRADMKTPIARFAESIGLRHTKAADKCVPACVFRLPREQLSMFLRTMFTCDGSVFANHIGKVGVSYSTISRRLAEDVQHLLLRFGLVAKLRTKHPSFRDGYTAYEVTLHGVSDTRRFLDEVGIIGRQAAIKHVRGMADPSLPSTHRDTIPTGELFWLSLQQASNGNSFARMRERSGVTIFNRRHERPLSRHVVSALAMAYPHPHLLALAEGDVYWDEIESITPCGKERVYDISVDADASFVANDLILHNSTLLTQAAVVASHTIGPTLYVSGEESAQQIKMRAERLGVGASELYLLTETNLEAVLGAIEAMKPKLCIVDSIQTIYTDALQSSPGTVTQVRECAQRLQAVAKGHNVAIFIVGHVTKEGTIAGPKVLEHIVDTVLQLEGDRFHAFRMLRSMKNRFGATSEVGVFEMAGDGMREVINPSEAFLSERMAHAPGSSVAVTMEGTRPLLVEVQALTSSTQNPMPRRTANGFDYNRLFLLIAVLGKRVGIRLHDQDVFVNVVGGMTIDEPAADLAAAIAIASASKGAPVPNDMAIIGEVGLSGEIRSVSQLNQRLNEAAKLGFSRCILPKTARKVEHSPDGLRLIAARSLGEALDAALGT